jgi:cardiolipin synthase A/B
LKHSLEQSIETGTRHVSKNNWNTQTISLRMVSWLCYALIRFMIGMTGYASGNR